jgi:hypothetical protein
MNLDWRETGTGQQPYTWTLPRGTLIMGPAPFRFGIHISRRDVDSYAVRMVWDEVQLGWAQLTRREVLDSSLCMVLSALGTNLEYLLDQPARIEQTS